MTLRQRALELIEQQAAKHSAKRVTGAWLKIGAFPCVETDPLALCFDLVCRDSVAESYKLYLEEQEAECWYETCQQYVALLAQRIRHYPSCHDDMLQIVADDSLQIRRIEIDQEQTMYTTCGCGEGNLYIEGNEHNPHSAFRNASFAPTARPKMKIIGIKASEFIPSQTEGGDLHYGHGEASTHAPGMSQHRMLEVETDMLDKNNRLAERNRTRFAARKQLVLNLVSSPGSDRTTLLTGTLMRLKDSVPCVVIRSSQQTVDDAARIRATGTPAIQMNTDKGCHLDTQMIADAVPRLPLDDNGIPSIENVDNLVCPASFDLGEKHKVAVLSVTEGEDKPLEYPHMFVAASLMLLNKVDLLPYLNFNVEEYIVCAREVNPEIEIILISATSGEGMDQWLNWLEAQRCV